jgi:predicted benzoate:H+ symporter BenE
MKQGERRFALIRLFSPASAVVMMVVVSVMIAIINDTSR